MKSIRLSKESLLTILFAVCASAAFAQDPNAAPITANSLVLLLFTCVMLLVVFLAAILGDKIIKLAAEKLLGDERAARFGLVPSLKELILGSRLTAEAKKKIVKLNRGFDIKLNGKAKKMLKDYTASTYAVKPTDFIGLKPIPKMMVKEGAKLKAGDAIFYDKGFEGVLFTSPVSGELIEIRRGAKRAITEIVIASDGKFNSAKFKAGQPASMGEESVRKQLMESGAWTLFVERPFGVIANPAIRPTSIHISASDTSPLAVDYGFILKHLDMRHVQAGIDVLNVLSDKVVLHLDKNSSKVTAVDTLVGAEVIGFQGSHPAGNIGVQIHHVSPISKGDVAWTIKIEDLATIGRLFNEGVYAPEKIVAVAGSVLKNPHYVKLTAGANISDLIEGNLIDDNVRVVSGNVLSGNQIKKDGFLGVYHNLVSVLEEGDHHEMFGWLIPSYARPSLSPTFPWRMMDLASFDANTNTHGEQRAFVVTGQYEEVLPMDVYPQHLMKSIIKNDFEEMEGLGIYELIEEDVALAEFVCTSKQPLQHILREGLDYIRSQN